MVDFIDFSTYSMVPEGHPLNPDGVPDNFEPLTSVRRRPALRDPELDPGPLTSAGVKSEKYEVQGSA